MPTIREVTHSLMRQHGMTTIFGNPGSNELPFLRDFPEDFRYVLGLHEGAVVSMADGYAQVTGRPAFVNLHAASGSGNAMGSLTNAVYSHSPLVITAGQQVRSTIGLESMLANVDAAQLPKPLVKWSCEPACAEDVPRAVSQAVLETQTGGGGPVYLSIPYDDWDQEAHSNTAFLAGRSVSTAGSLSADQLSDLAERINDASNPALILGAKVDAEGANGLAVELAEKLGCEVWAAPSLSRLPFPNRHRQFKGVLPAAIADISCLLAGHDLVLVVGAPVFRYHQFVPGDYLAQGTELIQITDDVGEATRAPVGQAIVAGVADALAQLASAVASRELPPRPARAFQPAPETSGPLHPEKVFELLRLHAPEDAVYVVESTSTTGAFWNQMDLKHPGSYYFPASGGLGFGLPATVGAQMAHDQRQVIGLIGDGSANYGITALWSAAQYNIPAIFIILRNGTYGALRWFSQILDAGEVPGLDVPQIDFVHLAKGYGVEAVHVDEPEEFTVAFKSALEAGRPTLIEVDTALTQP